MNYGIKENKLWEIFRLADNDARFTTRTGKVRYTRLADYCQMMFGINITPEQLRNLFRKKSVRKL